MASLLLDCPHCGQREMVPGTLAGRDLRCAGCGQMVRVKPPPPPTVPPPLMPMQTETGPIIKHACPACLQRHAAPPPFWGRTIGCRRCKARFIIPMPPLDYRGPGAPPPPVVAEIDESGEPETFDFGPDDVID